MWFVTHNTADLITDRRFNPVVLDVMVDTEFSCPAIHFLNSESKCCRAAASLPAELLEQPLKHTMIRTHQVFHSFTIRLDFQGDHNSGVISIEFMTLPDIAL